VKVRIAGISNTNSGETGLYLFEIQGDDNNEFSANIESIKIILPSQFSVGVASLLTPTNVLFGFFATTDTEFVAPRISSGVTTPN
jgi:hypothetical protein